MSLFLSLYLFICHYFSLYLSPISRLLPFLSSFLCISLSLSYSYSNRPTLSYSILNCRSKILWLAALVDLDGLIIIINEELHVRLREIIEATSFPSPNLLDDSSFIPIESVSDISAADFCDSFCSFVINGVKSAAAPLCEVSLRLKYYLLNDFN